MTKQTNENNKERSEARTKERKMSCMLSLFCACCVARAEGQREGQMKVGSVINSYSGNGKCKKQTI